MKAETFIPKGSVIMSLKSYEIINDCMSLPSGNILRHDGTKWNSLVLGSFLVSRLDITQETEITVNFSQFIFDMSTGTEGDDISMGGFKNLSETEKQILYIYLDKKISKKAISDGFIPFTPNSNIQLIKEENDDQNGFSVISTSRKCPGEEVFRVNGLLLPFPCRSSVAISKDKHLRLTGGVEFMQHSCQPNVQVFASGNFFWGKALKVIEPGESITYNFFTTEWEIDEPFRCNCGCPTCYGLINGFCFLNYEQQKNLLPLCIDSIRDQYDKPLTSFTPLISIKHNKDIGVSDTGDLITLIPKKYGDFLGFVSSYQIKTKKLIIDDLCLQHSCNPTTNFIDGYLLVSQDLKENDPLTINLSMISNKLASPFECSCGQKECVGFVKGFDALPGDFQISVQPFLSTSMRKAQNFLKNGEVRSCAEKLAEIRGDEKIGNATFSTQPIAKGTKLFCVNGIILPFPTMYTIYLGKEKHLLFGGGAECLAHSCDPNLSIMVDPEANSLYCVALRNIEKGEILSFNYLCTEWDMKAPFSCFCGSKNCYGVIKGFYNLSNQEMLEILPHVTPGILENFHNFKSYSLSSSVTITDESQLTLNTAVEPSVVLFEFNKFEIEPMQVIFGAASDKIIVPHSSKPNALLVENRVVSFSKICPGEVISLNMNLIVCDLESFFPRSMLDDDCRGFRYLPEGEKQRLFYLTEPDFRRKAIREGFQLVSESAVLEIRPNGKMGQAAFASCFIPEGTLIGSAGGFVIDFPTMYTICIGENAHLLFGKCLECIAHHCDPNTQVIILDNDSLEFRAIKPIEKGELVTFSYLSSEWIMNSPFECLCDSSFCVKNVRGFSVLTEVQQNRLLPLITSYIYKEFINRKRC